MLYTEGCLPKGSQWFERHILPVAIVIVIFAVLQVNKSSVFKFHNFFFLSTDTWYLFCSKSS